MATLHDRIVFPLGNGTPFEKVQKFWATMSEVPADARAASFFPSLYDITTPVSSEIHSDDKISATQELSTTVYKVRLVPELGNWYGNTHGGAVCTLFDVLTSLALIPHARENYWTNGGVTQSLSCRYVRPIPTASEKDEYIAVIAHVTSISKRSAVVRGVMRRYNGDGSMGEVLAICSNHDKVAVSYPKV